MERELENGAEVISLFCRLYVNNKKGLPIRSSEMGLLILIVQQKDQITSVQAANFFKVSKPMITSMVNSLEKKGYIKKIYNVNDKRSFILTATSIAKELVEKTHQEYYGIMELLENRMGDDYTSFIKLLNKANKILLEAK